MLFLVVYLPNYAQDFPPAPEDKAVVYFVRASSLGFAINFSYFDSTELIARFNGTNYIRYECEPGHHLFWARSENRDFVHAEVEAGKIYIIEVVPKMGGVKAAVRLVPVDPTTHNMKKINKLFGKKPPLTFSDMEIEETEDELAEVVRRGMNKYEETRQKRKPIKALTSEMYFETGVN